MPRNALTPWMIVLTLAADPSAWATDFTWNAPAPGNGVFASPICWAPFNIFVPILGPPGPGEMATFDLAGGAAAYTVTFNNSHTNARCRVGDDAVVFNLGAFVYILNPGSSPDAALMVGYGSGVGQHCSLTLTHGALIAPSAALAPIAGLAEAELIVGAGAQMDVNGLLDIGVRDTGVLTIHSGGNMICDTAILGHIVDVGQPPTPAGNGAVTVTGTSSTWTVHGNLIVGDEGPGTLNVVNGADVTANGQSGETVLANYGGSGAILVSDAGSTFTTPSDMLLGYDGLGTVNVLAGGRINSGSVEVGADFGGGVASVGGPGSRWTSTGLFRVNGPVTISAGGEVQAAAGAIGTTGAVNISGANSKWTMAGLLDIGYHDLAQGLLSVTGGALVTSGSGSIADGDASHSLARVQGPDSSWSMNGALQVGGAGDGVLEISAGGHVACGFLSLGLHSNAEGSVMVEGQDSLLDASNIRVGNGGHGVVDVTHGGRVEGNMLVGQTPGSGNVLIDGADSLWTAGSAWIGFAMGAGTLEITGGGRLESTQGDVGTSIIHAGHVTIAGIGSTWAVAEDLQIGVTGAGTLTARSGGVVSAGEIIEIGPNGRLEGDGRVNAPIENSGVIAPGNPTGVLRVTGALTQQAGGALNIEIAGTAALVIPYDRLSVTGDVALGGTLNVALLNGSRPAPGEQFTIIESTAGAITGTFAQVNAPPDFEIVYTPGAVIVELPGPACLADIAPPPGGDGVVNVNDLLLVVGNWGATGANVADVNGDNVVNVNDLLAVVGAWGACP